MMNYRFYIQINLILICLTLGFLIHHLAIFIPQQHLLIQEIELFKNQFGTTYIAQQFNLLKFILVPWILELIIAIFLISKQTGKFQKFSSIANLGLFGLSIAALLIADLPLQLILSNGYHVFAYKMSTLIHGSFLTVWSIRLFIMLMNLKTASSVSK